MCDATGGKEETRTCARGLHTGSGMGGEGFVSLGPVEDGERRNKTKKLVRARLALRAYNHPIHLEHRCHTSLTDPLPACQCQRHTSMITETITNAKS